MKTSDFDSEFYTKHLDLFCERYLGMKLFRYQKIMLRMICKGQETKQKMRGLK